MRSQEREAEKQGRRTFTLRERATLRMAESVMSNYTDSRLALLDLIDNCVDNRIAGRPLTIRVFVTKDSISISNSGGQGLDQEGLENFLVWGHSDKTRLQIGQYGVGGKAAMGFLGKSLEVSCSSVGSRDEYKFYDPDWETKSEESEKIHEGEIRTVSTEEGYFRVKISKLKRQVRGDLIGAQLGDIYRPLLSTGEVIIKVNNKEVVPLEIKYVEDDPNLSPDQKVLGTPFGDRIRIRVGVLEGGQRVKPGIRCYYRGRLVEAEQFFDHPKPAQLPQASRLIGEAHLDFLNVTTNKSNFIKDDKWNDVGIVIHRFLEPWVRKLEGLKADRSYEVEEYEELIAKQVKRALEHILSQHPIFTRDDIKGEAAFRLPPTASGGQRPTQGPGRNPTPREGATPPNIRADVGPNIKRWGMLFDWKTVPMGVPDKRSDIVNTQGKDELCINTDFPMYQTAKQAGRDALWLYQAETAVLEICRRADKDKTLDVFVEDVNSLVSFLGEFYGNESLRTRGRISSRGSLRFN